MRFERATISAGLVRSLNDFGRERGSRLACIVMLRDDEFEFVWPGGLSESRVRQAGTALLAALADELALSE